MAQKEEYGTRRKMNPHSASFIILHYNNQRRERKSEFDNNRESIEGTEARLHTLLDDI